MTTDYQYAAKIIQDKDDVDVLFFNGQVMRGTDLEVIRSIYNNKSKDSLLLILVTSGGNADAAYKIARYIQNHYKKFTVLVSGICKSAGTLIAVGANEIAFSPYGELGPIDVQMYKTDNLAERESGLTITEALEHLTSSALRTHGKVFEAIMSGTNAIISFKTATQAASELVTGLYAPMFSQIDPTDVGEKARSMRIASDYARRLDARVRNLKYDALNHLTQTYPSHSFVIDMKEAESLFNNIRDLSEEEQVLVDSLDKDFHLGARYEIPAETTGQATILSLGLPDEQEGDDDQHTERTDDAREDGRDPAPTTETPENVPERTADRAQDGHHDRTKPNSGDRGQRSSA